LFAVHQCAESGLFYTRPNLPQLGIDLVDVHGGGSCPSQFYGRTADGRQIYIRYRDGWLDVWAGDESDPEELLSASIGPAFNGDMLLEQACDLTGISIRGEKPSLSEEQWREAAEGCPVLDWSGRTTYWVRDVLISMKGAERFARELAAAFPDMRMFEVTWLDNPFRRVCVPRLTIAECKSSVLFGFGADERRLEHLVSGRQVSIADLDRAFAHQLRLQIRWNKRWESPEAGWVKLGVRRPEHARQPGNIEVPNFDLLSQLDTKFATGDPAGERYIRKLIETFDRCFSSWAEDIDLDTGEVVGRPGEIRWYSLDLRGWCNAAPNRFLFWQPPQKELPRKIGVRPCRVPNSG